MKACFYLKTRIIGYMKKTFLHKTVNVHEKLLKYDLMPGTRLSTQPSFVLTYK